ncbi:HIRAN domain-containing protein [Micromonospora sp. NPDC051925]|uniref:HIRAN domain-containing protein n=1 Tax=Micromonospora sp. NPDC051925 TaxID=3364288 RepID=UPI0037C59C11
MLPEPTNRFDRNAVKVVCGGNHVGYLPKEQAAEYAPVLTALVDQGWTPQVQARVWGQEYEDWENTARRSAVRCGSISPNRT